MLYLSAQSLLILSSSGWNSSGHSVSGSQLVLGIGLLRKEGAKPLRASLIRFPI